jgi:hypothetical protein
MAKNEPHFLLIIEAKKLGMDGNTDLKCDLSAEDYEKGRIWTKSGQK